MSGNIEHYIVGTTTAVPGYYLCFHPHKTEEAARWTQRDTEKYFQLSENPGKLNVVEGKEVSENLASTRLEPVIIRIWTNRALRKLTIVTPQESPEVISYPAADQIRRSIVAKGGETLHLSDRAVAEVGELPSLE